MSENVPLFPQEQTFLEMCVWIIPDVVVQLHLTKSEFNMESSGWIWIISDPLLNPIRFVSIK